MKMSKKSKENIIGIAVVILILAIVCFSNNERGLSFASCVIPLIVVAIAGEWLLCKNEKNFSALHKTRLALKGKRVRCIIIQFVAIFAGVLMINQAIYIEYIWNILIGIGIGILQALAYYLTSNQGFFSEATDE